MNIDELLHTLQNAVNELNGKDVRIKSALELIEETVSKIPEISSRLSLDNFQLNYETEHFGKTPLFNFNVQYATDNRTCDGLSYRIKAVEIMLIKDLPLTLDISMLNRRLELDIVHERNEMVRNQIKILEQQIATDS